ncbi:hypothetical protein Ahy_A06g029928 isoform D [Arachis hypogaea]|uniref:Uncharacterized protein n=1 Tax=Arachis hypogaea TaxID=3818 RepID=A0A444YT82_ARAHY|nr:hypothetical protein Ahy_B06g084983 isoform D [Arachis hypogaea]RYR54617.1 hypothetical protein Ahy_A06g029928 isoform D [Arachis hypogaea]
MRCNPIRGRTP